MSEKVLDYTAKQELIAKCFALKKSCQIPLAVKELIMEMCHAWLADLAVRASEQNTQSLDQEGKDKLVTELADFSIEQLKEKVAEIGVETAKIIRSGMWLFDAMKSYDEDDSDDQLENLVQKIKSHIDLLETVYNMSEKSSPEIEEEPNHPLNSDVDDSCVETVT